MDSITNLSAGVVYRNTPESDRQSLVLHWVSGKYEGKEVIIRLMAPDPKSAIDLARNMPVECWTATKKREDGK